MAKKKSTATRADQVGLPKAPKSNSAVVREILASGVTKPSEVVRLALEKYELNISLPLVNQVKMKWKKDQGAGPKISMKRGPKKAIPTSSKPDAHTVGNPRPTELDVAKFALKMGGVDSAIAALKDLIK